MSEVRRIMLANPGGGGGVLPAEYQQVEYLQSTGTQYILPGFTPQDDTGVDVDFKYNVSASGNNIIALLGAQNTSGLSNYWDINDTPYNNYINFEMNYPASSGYGTAVSLIGSHSQSKHNAKINYCNSGAIYLDDVSKGTYTHNRSGGPTNYPMALFADNLNGTAQRFFQGNIYHVAFSEGANVIRDMYPCYRKSDGVAGMYDVVNNVFYTNSGTGEFICGRSIVTDDARFTQVLAIQSSGTQYIDTDVKMNGTYTTNALFKTGTISSSETFKVFGGRDNSNFYTFGMYSSGHTSAPTTCGYGGSDYWSSSLVSNTDYNLLFTSTGAKLNGTSVGTWSSQSFSSNVTFYLFGTSYNSTASQLASIAMSCFRIKPSAYTRDFIPCVLKQSVIDYWGNSQVSGTIGMWDLISDKFFPNNGTGTFTAAT